MDKEKIEMKKIKTAKHVTFSKRKKGIFKKAQELSILCDAHAGLIIFSAAGKLFEYSNISMKQILERHSLHSKNMEEPSSSEWLPGELEGEHTMLSKEMAEKILPLRKMMEEAQQVANSEELEQLEKSLEAALSRLQVKQAEKVAMEIESLEEKGRELMEENNRLRHQKTVMEMSRAGKLIPADLEYIIREKGRSSESVTTSSGLPRDHESADTTLKWGLNYRGFTG